MIQKQCTFKLIGHCITRRRKQRNDHITRISDATKEKVRDGFPKGKINLEDIVIDQG